MKKVFPGVRGEWSLALLAVGSTALTACGSDRATYRPAPRYTTSPPTAPAPYQPQPYPGQPYPQPGQTYPQPGQPYQPTGPSTTPPPPPPPRGQMACGKGKCG